MATRAAGGRSRPEVCADNASMAVDPSPSEIMRSYAWVAAEEAVQRERNMAGYRATMAWTEANAVEVMRVDADDSVHEEELLRQRANKATRLANQMRTRRQARSPK